MNDATGLVAYKFALAAAATGTFSFANAGVGFLVVSAGGVAVGLLAGWIFTKLLCWIRDDLIDIVVSLIVPYVAYLGAERLPGNVQLKAVESIGRPWLPNDIISSRCIGNIA